MSIFVDKFKSPTRTYCLDIVTPMSDVLNCKKVVKIFHFPANPNRIGEGGLRIKDPPKISPYSVAEVNIQPKITVITVTFNAAKTLEQTIVSILRQGYSNLELIIIDGGSEDGTLNILRKFEDSITYWVSEPDKGIFDAWNKGVSVSSGDWIAFLGADDTYIEGALDAYASAIKKNSGCELDYISSRVNLIKDGKVVRVIGECWSWKVFSRYMNVAHVGSLHNASLFKRWEGYDPTYRICGDYELLLRPGVGLRTDYFDQITINMSVGGVSDSNWRALLEMAKAKIHTGGRNKILSYYEFIIAVLKWKIRRWVWY